MLLFGHIRITLGIAWFAKSKLKVKMDYGLIFIGSLLPDIFEFPAKEHLSFYEYFSKIISEYTSLSHIFISEVIGLIIILAFFLKKSKLRAKPNS